MGLLLDEVELELELEELECFSFFVGCM
jgi:hypothetical protein